MGNIQLTRRLDEVVLRRHFDVMIQSKGSLSTFASHYRQTWEVFWIAMTGPSVGVRDFVWVKGNLVRLRIRLDQWESRGNSARILIWCGGWDSNLAVDFKQCVSRMRARLLASGLRRAVAYVMPGEREEKRILESIGFSREVVLDDHLVVDGGYRSLEVWGAILTPSADAVS